MKRLVDLVTTGTENFFKKQDQLLLDFGSSAARFYRKGKLVATKISSLAELKAGTVEEVHLVEQGTMVDFAAATNFLNQTVKDLVATQKLSSRFDGYYLLPSDANQVDQLIIKKVLGSLDYGSWHLISKKVAARSSQGCVIDIGFDLTEVILGFGSGTTAAKTIKFGARALTGVIREVIREKHQLDVSWQMADRVKKELVGRDFLLATDKNTQKLTVRGKDIFSFVPKTVTINASDLQLPLLAVANDLFEEIKLFFSRLSTDILMNSIERGVELWGDGSRLAGLDNFFTQKLQTKVRLGQPTYEVKPE